MCKCKVVSCDRQAMYKSQMVCQMHYFRMMRTGSYKKKGRSLRTHNAKGYQMLYLPDHPLAMKNGYAYEHRVVMHQLHGDNPMNCNKCGKAIDWSTVHVDHINEDVKDNSPENLRFLCNGCNVMRTRKHQKEHTKKRRVGITCNGITLTATEWSRMPNVKVSRGTISRRIKNGSSPYDAIYGEKETHISTLPKSGYTPKYKNTHVDSCITHYRAKLKELKDAN
ncbi:TPA: HNH endonuclease [Proteus mirabilis]|nr:HNH endonuclease [Proteus mirabilis]